jgi:hypothetical protein
LKKHSEYFIAKSAYNTAIRAASEELKKYLEEFESDMQLVHSSWALITQTKELGEFLNDTRIKYGASGYEKARVFYKEAQGAEKLGVAGAAGVVRELQSRFKGQASRQRRAPTTAPRQKSRRKLKPARVS